MRIFLSSPCSDFEAVAPIGADLDGRFDAFELSTGQWMVINGWNCELKPRPGPIDGEELPDNLRAWNRLQEHERTAIMATVGECENPHAQMRACLAAMGGPMAPAFVGAA